MVTYIIRRVLISLLIVFLISIFAFSLMHVLPGDPARISLGEEASQEAVDELRAEWNLDKPLLTQYWLWVSGIFTKDFGESYAFNRPVYDIISERLPRTLAIGVPAIVIAAIFGVCFGILSAVKRGKWLDQVLTVISTLGLGTPSFWLGIFCIYVFALELKWFPVQGFTSPSKDFAKYVYMAILPVFCMSFQLQASVARQTRSNMLEVVNQDYIRTARANGLSETRIIFRHALKNALIPVVTIIGLQVRIAIGGSLIVENVFNIPGIGNMLTTGVINRDYVLVQTGVLIVSLFTVGCNLLVDILYGFIDPRIRESWG